MVGTPMSKARQVMEPIWKKLFRKLKQKPTISQMKAALDVSLVPNKDKKNVPDDYRFSGLKVTEEQFRNHLKVIVRAATQGQR